MAYNNLVVQDYCNMIEGFINNKYFNTFAGIFSEAELYAYCINKTETLDEKVKEEVFTLVYDIICALKNNGVVKQFGKSYRVVRPITKKDCIRSFSEPQRITKINQGIIDSLKNIDEKTSCFNDPTANPLTTENEM